MSAIYSAPLFQSSALVHHYGYKEQLAHQNAMALANTVPATSNPATVGAIHAMDKAYALQAAHSQVMFQASLALQERAQQRLKAHENQKKRLMELGATFV